MFVYLVVVWQAASNNYNQFLQVDLGDRRLITRVATQGYRGSGQFVIDYHISHSNDATSFTEIVNDLGEPEVIILTKNISSISTIDSFRFGVEILYFKKICC